MTLIEIYPMQKGEGQEIYELILREFYEHVAPVYAKQGIAKFLGMLSPEGLDDMRRGKDSFVIVAKVQDKIVGMLSVINHSHIALIFVDQITKVAALEENLWMNVRKKAWRRALPYRLLL
jgi:hypothetical protein